MALWHQARAIEVLFGSAGAQDAVPPVEHGQLHFSRPPRHPGISASAVDFDVSHGMVHGIQGETIGSHLALPKSSDSMGLSGDLLVMLWQW